MHAVKLKSAIVNTICFLSTSEPLSIQIDGAVINSSQTGKVLGVHFENIKIRKIASRKLNALARLTPLWN